MGKTQTNSQRSDQEKSFFSKVREIGKELVVATIKYSIITVFTIVLALGTTTLYDITIGDQIPKVSNLGFGSPEKNLIHDQPILKGWNDQECWSALQESLEILDRVCPEASEWVRDKHTSKQIIWEEEFTGCYAKFNYIDRDLTVNRTLFGESNGRIASILAHEFRHSKQNFSKFFRSTVACSILREPNEPIVETDAELFELRVLLAIFE